MGLIASADEKADASSDKVRVVAHFCSFNLSINIADAPPRLMKSGWPQFITSVDARGQFTGVFSPAFQMSQGK